MKKFLLATCISFTFLFINKAEAQVSVGLKINIGNQPCWGPTGYDRAEFYYLPDIECYYNVVKHRFIYQRDGRWIFSETLPPMYSSFNLNSGYKVVLNGDPKPYLHFEEHRVQYVRYKNYEQRQPILHESNEDRYRNHWDDKRYGMKDHDDHRDHDHHDNH